MSIRMSPNSREVIGAISTITSQQEYLKSTNGALNVSGSFNLTGQAIPASGLTTAVAVQIVDGSGNQISSFGGGTQYTDGGVPPAHPIGNTIEWSDGSNWQTVSTAKPLPVTASFSPSGTQDVNLKQIAGTTTLTGNGVAGAGAQRVTIASDNTAFSVNATLSAETTKVIGTVNQGTSPWVVSNSVLSVVGNGAAATAQRVTLANDSTGVIATVGAVTAITNALPAGSNVIGHVITDTGSTTAVTGTVTISGAVTNAGTFAVQLTGATNNINNIAGTISLPTGASTLAEQQTQTTSLQLIDDTITAQGTALGTTKTSLIGGSVTTAAPTYTNGQISPLNLSTAGALRVDAGTVTVTATNLSTNLAQVSGTTTSVNNGAVDAGTQRVTLANNSTGVIATVAAVTAITNALPVGANVIGKVSIDQTTPGTTNLVSLTAETTKVIGVTRTADGSGNLITSSTNALDVNLKTSSITLPVSIAGTVVVDDLAAAPTGGAVPANAQYQGLNATTALPAAATPGNLTGQTSDKYGRAVVLNNATRDIMGTQTTTITSSTAETTIITQAASIFNDLTSIFISNTSATPVSVAIRDATAGTVIFTLYIPATDMRGISLTTPWPQTTVNNNWTATSSGSVASLIISALFVKNR